MSNIKVTITSTDSNAIKKIYRKRYYKFFRINDPLIMVRIYIPIPQKPCLYGLMIVERDGSFCIVNGNLLHHEHLYYMSIEPVARMLADMYSHLGVNSSNSSKIRVPSRRLDQQVPSVRY